MSLQNDQLLLFDVSTTQNTLPDAHLCPVEVCTEQFALADIGNSAKIKQTHFFIIPDEPIMPAAQIQMGKSSADISGEQLVEGLRRIYELLKPARFNGPCLLGYNLEYDIASVCDNMKRLFSGKDENLANFQEAIDAMDKIDVMLLAKKLIPASKVITYTMLNVVVYLYGLKALDQFNREGAKTGSVRDNYLCRLILAGLMKLGAKMYPERADDFSTVQGLLKFLQEPVIVDVFPFGKYMNWKISDVYKKHPDYIAWLLKDAEGLKRSNPDVYYTLKTKYVEQS